MTAVVCMRVESSRPTRNGEGWIHPLTERDQHGHTPLIFTPSSEPSTRADPQMLNRIYRNLHAELRLSGAHRRLMIQDRGLTLEEIRTLDYKTMPSMEAMSERAQLINPLIKRYGRKLLTVPGFYLTRRGRIWLAGAGRLLVPCKNVDGDVVGYQVRVDGAGKGKYRWFSASSRQRRRGGVSSGTPIHVAGCDSDLTQVWITEGIIKADIASLRLGETVIGVAGVSSWNRDELAHTLSKLYAQEVVIAFDADIEKNKHVRKAQEKLCQAVLSMGYRVSIASWDAALGKGLDDFLVNGHQPTIRRYYPPVDVDDLKSIGGEKRIRRVVAQTDLECQTSDSIDDLRVRMRNRIHSFAQFADGGALLIKGTQGISKSTSTIDIATTVYDVGAPR